jgi:hypothetical protein
MRFFFPDSQDLVDPHFDFEEEAHPEFRVRQRDDVYAHEVFEIPPFDGILVSKAIVDGAGRSGGKYTMAQRHRLLRVGIREFLRADNHLGREPLEIMGDCGAFTYRDSEEPPFTVEEVVKFYHELGFDLGISVDHVILSFNEEWDHSLPGLHVVPDEFKRRQELTLTLAEEFLRLCQSQDVDFTPLGVAQGWSPKSYARSVAALQRMGYDYIALGGLVPLKTSEILSTLKTVDTVRDPATVLHLLGVTRITQLRSFQAAGVISFDSTSPFLQAFKDAKDNYHTIDRAYSAIRVPQVEGSPKLGRLIRSGKVDQSTARHLEDLCLQNLRSFDKGEIRLSEVLDPLEEYEALHSGSRKRVDRYRETLEDRAWQQCPCDVCRSIGIEVVMFRGSERNKRRGFHNLEVFRQKLLAAATSLPLVQAH